MKRILVVALLACLAACSDPKEIVLLKGDDIQANAEQLKKLTEEEQKLLIGYTMRAEANGLFGLEKAEYGVTVGEAIEKQRQFIAEQERKEAQRKAEEEKARQELEAKRQLLNSAVSVIFVEHKPTEGEYKFQQYVDIKIKFTNNSDKTIIGTKGVTIFYDKFGDEIKRINVKNDFSDLNGRLEPGKEYLFHGSIDRILESDEKFANIPSADLKFVYQPEVVLFEDGTSLSAE